jgi:hypothetical protein
MRARGSAGGLACRANVASNSRSEPKTSRLARSGSVSRKSAKSRRPRRQTGSPSRPRPWRPAGASGQVGRDLRHHLPGRRAASRRRPGSRVPALFPALGRWGWDRMRGARAGDRGRGEATGSRAERSGPCRRAPRVVHAGPGEGDGRRSPKREADGAKQRRRSSRPRPTRAAYRRSPPSCFARISDSNRSQNSERRALRPLEPQEVLNRDLPFGILHFANRVAARPEATALHNGAATRTVPTEQPMNLSNLLMAESVDFE